ncbi:hypothetical protein [Oceaniovalibus sp. ACAM 378]|uniref:hypothetical protein n=1 Tax=Oceaniovalibus sp. ACAM 378 TaxID=2599923 RepID=UPI0011DA1D3A|nr:hypothetical protein [Oceaniovalibus sp. ACAM 378]TYB91088.1 hypothetical protein FQ320_00855 [Oceaniovalibus sp. ACAM 378]
MLIYLRFLRFANLPGAFFGSITGLEQSPMLTLVLIRTGDFHRSDWNAAADHAGFPFSDDGAEWRPGVWAELSALNMSGPIYGIWFGIPVNKMGAFLVADALNITTMMAVPGIVVATARLSDGNRGQADRKQPLDSPAS